MLFLGLKNIFLENFVTKNSTDENLELAEPDNKVNLILHITY